MKNIKTSIYSFLNENKNILNKSFNITNNDLEDILSVIRDNYSNLSTEYLNKYIADLKELTVKRLTTRFSFNENGLLLGLENFPKKIKLYRIVDSSEIDQKCLGRYWTYSKELIKNKDFHNTVGFDKDKDWFVIEGTFNKEDINIYETIEMLIINEHEREIRLNDKCLKPIEFNINKYEDY